MGRASPIKDRTIATRSPTVLVSGMDTRSLTRPFSWMSSAAQKLVSSTHPIQRSHRNQHADERTHVHAGGGITAPAAANSSSVFPAIAAASTARARRASWRAWRLAIITLRILSALPVHCLVNVGVFGGGAGAGVGAAGVSPATVKQLPPSVQGVLLLMMPSASCDAGVKRCPHWTHSAWFILHFNYTQNEHSEYSRRCDAERPTRVCAARGSCPFM